MRRRRVITGLAGAAVSFTAAGRARAAPADGEQAAAQGDGVAGTGSYWLDRFRAYDEAQSAKNNGAGYVGPFPGYSYAPSNIYAWDESYVLKGYVGAYLATKDTTYLDKLVEDFDGMVAQLHDNDGDGFRGWWTPVYSNPIIFNGGMETDSIYYKDSSGAYMADNWYPTPWYGRRDNIFRTNAEKRSGSYSTAIVNDGKQFWAAYTVLSSYTKSRRYAFAADAKTTGQGKVVIRVQETGEVLKEFTFGGTGWTRLAFDFHTPDTEGLHIRVYLTNGDHTQAGVTTYYDNISVLQYASYVEHDGMVLDPIIEFVETVTKDQALWPRYKQKAHDYLKLIEKEFYGRWLTLWKQWDDGGVPKGVIVFPHDDSARIGSIQEYYPLAVRSGGVTLPHNRYAIAGRTMLTLYRLTGKREYLDKAVRMGNFLKGTLTQVQAPNGKPAYIFQYWSPSGQWWDFGYTRVKSEDISHANLELGFAVALHKQGLVFTGEDMAQYANTFKYLLFNGDLADPKVREFVNGTGNQNYAVLIAEWLTLSQFDPEVLDISLALLKRSNQGYGPTYGMSAVGNLLKVHPELLNQ